MPTINNPSFHRNPKLVCDSISILLACKQYIVIAFTLYEKVSVNYSCIAMSIEILNTIRRYSENWHKLLTIYQYTSVLYVNKNEHSIHQDFTAIVK